MLFLILNKEVFDPYVHKDELMVPMMNHFIENDDFSHYSELYKELAQTNWLHEVFYIIGSIFSLIAITYFSREISKSIHCVA
tara:strand:- start:1351 stop:1596 length:246 start_codon:yes stop_codon:yes gene_type:complete